MIRSFFKAAVFKKAIFMDSWIILLSSFVLSFVMVFSFSMASSLSDMNRTFLFQDAVIDGNLTDEEKEHLDSLIRNGKVAACDLVGNLYGVIETRQNFEFVRVKEVDPSYFSSGKLALLHLSADDSQRRGFIISLALASKLAAAPGDRLAFVDSASGRAVMHDVTSVFDTGFSSFDEKFVFLVRDSKERTGKGQDKIYQNSRSYELISSSDISLRLFGKSAYGSYDYDLISDAYDGPLAGKVTIPNRSQLQMISSLDSVRFILFLFVLLSACYVFAFIRNFQRRTENVMKIYRILGCTKMRVLENLALTSVIAVSMLTGIALGLLFCFALKNALVLFDSWGLVSLDYYILKFPISVSWRDFLIYAAIVLGMFAIVRLFDLFKGVFGFKNLKKLTMSE